MNQSVAAKGKCACVLCSPSDVSSVCGQMLNLKMYLNVQMNPTNLVLNFVLSKV